MLFVFTLHVDGVSVTGEDTYSYRLEWLLLALLLSLLFLLFLLHSNTNKKSIVCTNNS